MMPISYHSPPSVSSVQSATVPHNFQPPSPLSMSDNFYQGMTSSYQFPTSIPNSLQPPSTVPSSFPPPPLGSYSQSSQSANTPLKSVQEVIRNKLHLRNGVTCAN